MTSVDFRQVLKDAKDVSGELSNQARNIDYFISELEDLLRAVDEEYSDLTSRIVDLQEKIDKGAEQRIQELELQYVTLVNDHISLQKENDSLKAQIAVLEVDFKQEIEDLKRSNQSLIEEFAISLR